MCGGPWGGSDDAVLVVFSVAYNVIVGGGYDEYTAGDLVNGAVERVYCAGHEVQYTLRAVKIQLFHVDNNRFAALEIVDDILGILVAYGMIDYHLQLSGVGEGNHV